MLGAPLGENLLIDTQHKLHQTLSDMEAPTRAEEPLYRCSIPEMFGIDRFLGDIRSRLKWCWRMNFPAMLLLRGTHLLSLKLPLHLSLLQSFQLLLLLCCKLYARAPSSSSAPRRFCTSTIPIPAATFPFALPTRLIVSILPGVCSSSPRALPFSVLSLAAVAALPISAPKARTNRALTIDQVYVAVC